MILTRHADTDPGFGELNGTGRARATALVETVGAMRITAIYSPNLERNWIRSGHGRAVSGSRSRAPPA